MGFWELLSLAFAVSMDAFAVSVCKGLCMRKSALKTGLVCGAWFGGFQALMPLIGFVLASLFAEYIVKFDHWVAFGLLVIIGINLVKESFEKEECTCDVEGNDLAFKTMFAMAVATSIDALAIGITLKLEDANIGVAVALIGVINFFMSAVGVQIGSVFGSKFEKKAQFCGGAILILLGVKILLEGLGVL